MSVTANSILRMLNDLSASADNIVEENSSEYKLPRLSEWISLIKNKANSIVESDNTSKESEEIPTLVSYLRGTGQRGTRASMVLLEIQKLHLHRGSRKVRKSVLSSAKAPLRRKSKVSTSNSGNSGTPKLKIQQRFEEKETPVSPPVISGKGTTSTLDRNSSSKRKSSTKLSLEKIKKPKINADQKEPNDPHREEKQMKTKTSSLLPNYASMKSSVSTANSSVVKENRALRSKMDSKHDKAVENRKIIMSARQQKLDANKKKREDKMEKTLELRLKIEKEKLNKLRSGAKNLQEKNAMTPKLQKIISENTTGKISKKQAVKSNEKQKKMPLNPKNVATSETLKGNDRTPVKKNEKPPQGTENVLNATYITVSEQPSTSSKLKIVKEAKIGSNLGALMQDKKSKTIKSSKTKKELQSQPISSTSSSKGLESYAMTPARSSFVSYDISEIRSDSEEDEPETTNSKPVPSWATGVRLRNALLQQHHHPIDTDELFGNTFGLLDLAVIMGVKKKHYNKRTSSAVWNNSFSFS